MSEAVLAALRVRAQSPAPITWVFLGDSITHGALHTWGHRDYVELFDERVRWELRRVDDVIINTAYSGFRARDILAQLEHRCLRFQPDMVSIMVGMNDAAEGLTGIPAFEDGYHRLIERLRRESAAQVFLHTTNTVDAFSDSGLARATLPQYNEAIRRVARDADLPLCDHYAVWGAYEEKAVGMVRQYLLSEQIHPNAYGHRLMADTLLSWIGYGLPAEPDPLAAFADKMVV